MITAIVLAAGESKRMGRPKMLLPWGDDTVAGRVIKVLRSAEIEDILVVTGSGRDQLESYLAKFANVRTAFNPDYERGEMLSSIQCGLSALKPETRAALICLGDQPQVQAESVRRVCAAFRENGSLLVVPSYEMRRGHPWLIARPLWDRLSELSAPLTARDFLSLHSEDIYYVNIDSSSVIDDLDTPGDYEKFAQGER
jgi:molybdenum cofactor cytidylyltransferase